MISKFRSNSGMYEFHNKKGRHYLHFTVESQVFTTASDSRDPENEKNKLSSGECCFIPVCIRLQCGIFYHHDHFTEDQGSGMTVLPVVKAPALRHGSVPRETSGFIPVVYTIRLFSRWLTAPFQITNETTAEGQNTRHSDVLQKHVLLGHHITEPTNNE